MQRALVNTRSVMVGGSVVDLENIPSNKIAKGIPG